MSAMQAEVFEAFRAIDVREDEARRTAALAEVATASAPQADATGLDADVSPLRTDMTTGKGDATSLEGGLVRREGGMAVLRRMGRLRARLPGRRHAEAVRPLDPWSEKGSLGRNRGRVRVAGSVCAVAAALIVARPAAAVVGASREAMGSIAAGTVMVLQRRGPAAGFCTGIVLGPRAVLTAAHCVPPGADIRVHFRDPAGAPVLLPVAGVVRHPGYRADAIVKRERSVDLAVVTLPEPLPDGFHAPVLGTEAGTTVGARFTVAGFGLAREGEPRTSGHLREADLSARAPLSGVLLWVEDPARGGAGACTGDSGGPVLDAAGAVVAVTLWSAGDGGRRCGALTQALWLAPYRAWIDGAARSP